MSSARNAAEALGLRVVQVQGKNGYYLVDAHFVRCVQPASFVFPGMDLDGLERVLRVQRETGLTGSPCRPHRPLRHPTKDDVASHVLTWLLSTRLSSLCIDDDWELCALALDLPVAEVRAIFLGCFDKGSSDSAHGENQ